MAGVRSSFEYTSRGVLFGVKINRRGPNFKNALKGAIPTGKPSLTICRSYYEIE